MRKEQGVKIFSRNEKMEVIENEYFMRELDEGFTMHIADRNGMHLKAIFLDKDLAIEIAKLLNKDNEKTVLAENWRDSKKEVN